MIIDTLDNLHKYFGLCPGLDVVADYLSSHSLETLSEGRHAISDDTIWANVQTCTPRSRENAPLEVHRDMIDVQIPLDGPEQHGYAPLTEPNYPQPHMMPRPTSPFCLFLQKVISP